MIFRHFASKEALLERIYQEIYLSKWDPRWQALLTDRTRPLSERLLMFYREYTTVIFDPEWVRIFMFAGLKGVAINARYFALLREHILAPIARVSRQSEDHHRRRAIAAEEGRHGARGDGDILLAVLLV